MFLNPLSTSATGAATENSKAEYWFRRRAPASCRALDRLGIRSVSPGTWKLQPCSTAAAVGSIRTNNGSHPSIASGSTALGR